VPADATEKPLGVSPAMAEAVEPDAGKQTGYDEQMKYKIYNNQYLKSFVSLKLNLI
jgi:hypothetical protein